MNDLAPDDTTGGVKSESDIMARLNALFPAFHVLAGPDDIDLVPYSTGLRDSIRFSVYEHLMGADAASEQQRRSIQMKLFCWCDMPGYIQAHEAMMKYSEEVKKFEDICLDALGTIERRAPTVTRARTSSTTSSSALASPNTPFAGSPETADDSFPSVPSRVSPAPPVPNPLLKGMPGRELSVAKTDGAAFTGDLGAPPVLAYPHDLSSTQFDVHPLAAELNMSSREKAQLGLIIPKQISRRDF